MASARIGAQQNFVAATANGAALGILCALALRRKMPGVEAWLERRLPPGPG
jgi:hypothetical protein